MLSAALVAVASLGATACEPPPPPVNFVVNRTADGDDAAPGDGVCEVTPGSGDCSLRAAVSEANAVPAGEVHIAYDVRSSLTETGVDDTNALGDLDLWRSGQTVIESTVDDAYIGGWSNANALEIHAGSVAIRGVDITGTAGNAIRVRAGGLVLEHSYLGGPVGLRVDPGAGAVVSNSTIDANQVGIVNAGTVVASFVTLAPGHTSTVETTGSTQLQATIVADAAAGPACSGAVTSLGWNVSDDTTCGLTDATDQQGLPLVLTAFDPPSTQGFFLPQAGSPALDAVPPGTGPCTSSAVDQFRRARPAGTGCEAGAVEADQARTFTVDSGADAPDAVPGDGRCATAAAECTLRAAIDEANATPVADVVELTTDVALAIPGRDESANATGDLDVTAPLIIRGNGHVLDAAGLDRALEASQDLHLEHLTLTGGDPGGGAGGAVLSWADLTIVDSIVTANKGVQGGGVAALGGTLTVTGSTFTANTALGGEIVHPTYGPLNIPATGGAVYVEVSATVDRSTFVGNTGTGSALHSGYPWTGNLGGPVTVRSSTIVDNLGTALVRDTHLFCASAMSCSYISGGSLTAQGVAIQNPDGGGCTGVSTSYSLNCMTAGPETDLELGPLADNGGRTPTFLPSPTSPVIDVIPSGLAGTCPLGGVDQRGVARPMGAGCDAGSVELGT
jgi:CSLREA domain-containing protein